MSSEFRKQGCSIREENLLRWGVGAGSIGGRNSFEVKVSVDHAIGVCLRLTRFYLQYELL